MMARITSHGEQRIRERLGLPVRAIKRAADNALVRGTPRTKFKGGLRRYLDMLLEKGKLSNAATDIKVYGGNIFLFAGEYLVTTWPVPAKFASDIRGVNGKRPDPKNLREIEPLDGRSDELAD